MCPLRWHHRGGRALSTGVRLAASTHCRRYSSEPVPARCSPPGARFCRSDQVAKQPLRSFGRATFGASAAFFLATSIVNWEGHAGGYWETRRMRWALIDLVQAQDAQQAVSGSYSASWPKELRLPTNLVGPTISLTPDGWTASLRHRRLGRVCAIFIGSTSVPPAHVERRPACARGSISTRRVSLALAMLLSGLALGTTAWWSMVRRRTGAVSSRGHG